MPWMRIILTVILLGTWHSIDNIFNIMSPYLINQTAIGQMDGTAEGYIRTQLGQQGVIMIYKVGYGALVVGLLLIWWNYIVAGIGEIRRAFNTKTPGGGAAIILLLLFALGAGANKAEAYKSKSYYNEFYRLKPNETGILVPLRGDVKEQGSFGSEEFLKQNVVASRQVSIPNAKVEGTGSASNMYLDLYYNSHLLYIIEHNPYSNVWTHNTKTGTSSRDESLKCETLDSISVRADIAAGAKIANPVAYLYHFGPDNHRFANGDTQATLIDPEKRENASIMYARTISDVMDNIARPMLQSEWCNRIMGYSLSTLSLKANDGVVAKVKALNDAVTVVKKSMEERGLSILFMGYANELTYEGEGVQAAIDRRFVAETNAAAAPILKDLAYIEMMHGLAKSLRDGSIKMPENLVVIPSNWVEGSAEWMAKFKEMMPKEIHTKANP